MCNADFGLHNQPLALLLFENKVLPSFLSVCLSSFAYLLFVLHLDVSLDLNSPFQLGDNQWLRRTELVEPFLSIQDLSSGVAEKMKRRGLRPSEARQRCSYNEYRGEKLSPTVAAGIKRDMGFVSLVFLWENLEILH